MPGESDFTRLYNAFASDGFRVKRCVRTESGSLGALARHKTAANHDTGIKKVAYYLEGTPYERGYLLGLLAEPEISDMAINFVENIVFDFLNVEFLNVFPLLKNIVVDIVQSLSQSAWMSQPPHVRDEAVGMLDGCKKSNPATLVTSGRISVMNVGFDVLCALIYLGNSLRERLPQLSPKDVRLAMACNAFSVFGDEAGGGHYFGRDFMFATGTALQNNLAHFIIRPVNAEGRKEALYPYVSVAAPGIIGSISAMNINGVAAGVNMSPAANCDAQHIGMNSLLLIRECIMRGASAADAVGVILNTRRGVSWNYAISDGSSDTACVVEAGASNQAPDFLNHIAQRLLPLLPDESFLQAYSPAPLKRGAVVRWCNEAYPDSYLRFNRSLWQYYKNNYDKSIRLYPDAFSPAGFINRTPEEKNCPSSFYFAPLRTGRNVIIATNHFLMPHMRLFAMEPWCAQIASGSINYIQWRYDELNFEINQAQSEHGSISYEQAKRLIDFLAPYGKFPRYYENNPKSRDGKAIRIEGCVSLFDLKKRSAESHYGYYADEWVKTTLPAYFDSGQKL